VIIISRHDFVFDANIRYILGIVRSQAWISIVSAGSILVWKLDALLDKLCYLDSTVVLAIESDSLLTRIRSASAIFKRTAHVDLRLRCIRYAMVRRDKDI
jgi:hypothetical protein